MKRLIAALMIMTSLFSVASADALLMAKIYNSYAELIFDLPQVDLDVSYTTEDAVTGGIITLWQDDNVMIGFIESQDGDMIGAMCADMVNNDAEFLVRCACILYTFEMWDEKLYSPLLDAYIHARKITNTYGLDLNEDERLLMGKSSTGYAMYIVPIE